MTTADSEGLVGRTLGHYDPVARRDLAHALMTVGRPRDAIDELRLALKPDPHASRAASSLVLLLAEAGENDEPLATFDQVSARGVDTPDLRRGHAMALMGQARPARRVGNLTAWPTARRSRTSR